MSNHKRIKKRTSEISTKGILKYNFDEIIKIKNELNERGYNVNRVIIKGKSFKI